MLFPNFIQVLDNVTQSLIVSNFQPSKILEFTAFFQNEKQHLRQTSI